MKLTAKLAKLGFDHKYFLESIDFKDKGTMKFPKLLRELRDRFGLVLSKTEQQVLAKYLLLQAATASSSGSPVSLKEGVRSLTSLLLTQPEFHSKIKLYQISKAQFI